MSTFHSENSETTIESLRVKRYKVVPENPWPESVFKCGDIILLVYDEKANASRFCLERDPEIVVLQIGKYPHIFKELQWWEDRTIQDLECVKYLKYISQTTKQYKYQQVNKWIIGPLWNKETTYANSYMDMADGCYEIATEEEFNNYVNN